MDPNTAPDALGPAPLTDALRASGALDAGHVTAVTIETADTTILSRILRVRLTYAGPVASAPPTIICKSGHPDRIEIGRKAARHEIAFYTKVAPATPSGLLPRCFGSHGEKAPETWHLLLEDLGPTHTTATRWPLPPTTQDYRRIVRTWARFHAAWWNNPRLGADLGTWTDAHSAAGYVTRLEAAFQTFADHVGDRLPKPRRHLIERFLAAAPRLAARYQTRHNLTIAHGDAHSWNCLLPRDNSDDVRLFDWDCWRLGLGTDDLAYMMAVHWYPDLRHEREQPLLEEYHRTLTENGVHQYTPQDLQADYRLSVLWQIATPIWQQAYGIPPAIWWNNLSRVFLAVDDLACQDLLA